ncbi:hypothetical protein [Priestia megaterium]|uniref:hypothetical protein n=1 Tax=Priestia megaterium TaxID=1404 RepID=UPI00064CBBA4|nr:hypothetical protein [Priestia megaterium]KLV28945.1 hypothetical protein ABW04_26970 [Priestia megaterium]MCE4092558.1 hypothetical protein [Priestia megaterium]
MKLDPIEILRFLRSKNINFLYHANTVFTACTFIQQGGLLSRGAVENYGLNQTPQTSDDLDKKYNVWNDIFFDSSDLHERFNRQNHYGPVLFKFDVEILASPNLPELWITKDNPIRWTPNQTNNDRYFQNIEEIQDIYHLGSYREMITLRFTQNILPFQPYLKEIILDNPGVKDLGLSFGTEAEKILIENIQNKNINNIPLTIRDCSNCFCKDNYQKQVGITRLTEAFLI